MEAHAQEYQGTAHGEKSANAKMDWLNDGATQQPLLNKVWAGHQPAVRSDSLASLDGMAANPFLLSCCSPMQPAK